MILAKENSLSLPFSIFISISTREFSVLCEKIVTSKILAFSFHQSRKKIVKDFRPVTKSISKSSSEIFKWNLLKFQVTTVPDEAEDSFKMPRASVVHMTSTATRPQHMSQVLTRSFNLYEIHAYYILRRNHNGTSHNLRPLTKLSFHSFYVLTFLKSFERKRAA